MTNLMLLPNRRQARLQSSASQWQKRGQRDGPAAVAGFALCPISVSGVAHAKALACLQG